jgi:fluoroacetyl-CoA thioesterase
VKESLAPGLEARRRIVVDKPRTIDFMGDALRVYATPELVRDIEHTCRDLLLEHLEANEDSVGTRVELDHIGATLLGMEVEITVRIAAVEGRQVSFEVEAADGVEPVARGAHKRFVVEVGQLQKRLEAKAAKAKA